MTDHEMLLLRAAVETSEDVRVQWSDGEWHASTSRPPARCSDATLADALTALLRDLGAEVPEWPSEPQMMNVGMALIEYGITEEQVAVLGSFPLPELLAVWGGS